MRNSNFSSEKVLYIFLLQHTNCQSINVKKNFLAVVNKMRINQNTNSNIILSIKRNKQHVLVFFSFKV